MGIVTVNNRVIDSKGDGQTEVYSKFKHFLRMMG